MKKMLLLICTIFFLMHFNGYAQIIEVNGKITGTDDVSLEGAAITVKGTTTGTLTDNNGQFSLRVSVKAILIITFTGHKTKEVSVNGRSFINEKLLAESKQLEDVVVIGYQTTTRKSVTTAISSVNAKEIESFTSGNVANAIQGKLAGVQVISGSGLPGAQPTILVRGLSSLTANTTPLVIVDGIEINYNSLNFINPLDIATIDVLKDASASAIYGSRAGQGVILITTKRGKGKPVINFQSSVGLDVIPNPGLADGQEYMRIMNRTAANSNIAPYFPSTNIPTYNYWDNAFDKGIRQNYLLSASGGKDGLSFYGSLGYYHQDSYNASSKGGNWKKISARFNVDYTVNKVIKFGMNFSPRFEKWLGSPNVMFNAYTADPTNLPFKTADSVQRDINAAGLQSSYTTAFNPYYSQFNRSPFNGVDNPNGAFARNFDNNDFFGAEYATYFELKPLQNLTVKTVIEGLFGASNATDYSPKYFLASNASNQQEVVSQNTQNNRRWKITNTANYKLSFLTNHNMDILVGQSADSYIVKGTNVSKTGIPFDLEPYRYVSGATTLLNAGGYSQDGAAPFGKMSSLFGSLRYDYNGKYFVSATMRQDKSSLVNPIYRTGYFPTISAAWIVSDEIFFEKLSKTINYLKIRGSWGKAGGNLPGSVGAYLSVVSPSTYLDGSGNVQTNGRVVSNIADPAIKWEVQEDFTIGLDGNMLKNKLDFSIEAYKRNPKNLLASVTLDPVLGYPQGYIASQTSNIGQLTTKGFDISLGYRDNITKKLNFGVNLVVSHWKSIVDYAGNADPIRYNLQNDVITTGRSRLTKGHEPGAWFGYIVDGVFQTDAEAVAYKNKDGVSYQPLAKAGDLKFRDANNDGVINIKDLSDLGSPWPKLTTGLTLTFNYSGFDLRAEFYGAFGQEYSNDYRLLMQGTTRYNFLSGLGGKFWSGTGSTNSFPIMKNTDPNGNFSKMSSFLLEDADYVRCRVIQLGYTIPPQLIKGIKSIRVYLSAQNLFTMTKYSGLNPELPFQGIGLNGIDRFTAITPKTYLFGVNLSL